MQLRNVHPKLAMDSVVRGVAILQDRALRTAGLDLTAQQATVAVLLLDLGSQPVHELTSYLEVNQPAMTRLVNRLENKQLVERSPSIVDGRVVDVALTVDGAEKAFAARQVIDDLKKELLADIDSQDLNAFWRVLNTMRSTVADRVSTDPL